MENLEKSNKTKNQKGVNPFTEEQRAKALAKSRKDGLTVMPLEHHTTIPAANRESAARSSGAFRINYYTRERMGNPKFADIKVNPFKNEITLTAGTDIRLRPSGATRNQPNTFDFSYYRDVRYCQSGKYEYIGDNTYRLVVDNK